MNIDPKLLARCQKNDRKAHNELYKSCFGYLMAICLRYETNREDAEILLNHGFLKIVTQLDKYKSDVPFKSWIGRVMVNTIIDLFRRDKKRRDNMSDVDLAEINDTSNVDFNEAAQELEAEELEKMIQKLLLFRQQFFIIFIIKLFKNCL